MDKQRIINSNLPIAIKCYFLKDYTGKIKMQNLNKICSKMIRCFIIIKSNIGTSHTNHQNNIILLKSHQNSHIAFQSTYFYDVINSNLDIVTCCYVLKFQKMAPT